MIVNLYLTKSVIIGGMSIEQARTPVSITSEFYEDDWERNDVMNLLKIYSNYFWILSSFKTH